MRLVAPGTIIEDRYVVEGSLGEGATGTVVEARHCVLHQRVAIKILLPEARGELPRFVREAQALAMLKSPHAVRVIDFGTLPSGSPYMVMELLDGCDLGMVLRENRPVEMTFAVDCIMQACDAVAEAHRRGLVHRDLKPENLFLVRDVNGAHMVKVLDFGTAQGEERLTRTHEFLGTPAFMAPEQTHSANVDARADVWSLGAILYALLGGAAPFEGENIAETLLAVRDAKPAALRATRPHVPAELEAVVLACLLHDVNQRIASVEELAARLLPFTSSRTRHIAARLAASKRPSASGVSGMTALSVARPRSRSSFLRKAVVAIAMTTALGGAAALVKRAIFDPLPKVMSVQPR